MNYAFLFLLLFPLLAQAQNIAFKPELSTQKELRYYLFKENMYADDLQKKDRVTDTTIIGVKLKSRDGENSVITFRYDYSKSDLFKTKQKNFNYILGRMLEQGVEVKIDALGNILSVENRNILRSHYKATLQDLIKTSKKPQEKKEYENMMNDLNDSATLDYLVLEDIEVFFELWNSEFDITNTYQSAKGIENPYSVYPIPAISEITFATDAQNNEIEATVTCVPSTDAAKELQGILEMLTRTKIIPKNMSPEEIFDINEEFKFLYDTHKKCFKFISKLRVHTEVGKDKLKTTKFILMD